MDVNEIRHRNLLLLLDQLRERGVTLVKDQAAQLGDLGSSYLGQLRGSPTAKPKKMGDDTARKIEAAVRRPHGWLDQPQWDRNLEPISLSDATLTHPSPARYQRVQVRGIAMVDAEGFWQELEESKGDEFVEASTSDPNAYAVRILGRRFYPVIDSGQCILMAPSAPLRMHKRVLVRLADGRHTVRLYLNHQDGLWLFASLTDANDVLELREGDVAAVERVVAVSDSE